MERREQRYPANAQAVHGECTVELEKCEGTLRGAVGPQRRTKGVKPSAVKAASSVLNGGDEETGLVRPRLVTTQLECEKGGAGCHGGSPSPSQGLVSPRPRGDRGGATSSYRLSASLVLPRASHEGASHSRPSPVMEATRERQMPSWPVSHGCLENPRSACVRVGTQPSAGAGRVADTGSSDRETPKVCHTAPAVRSPALSRK